MRQEKWFVMGFFFSFDIVTVGIRVFSMSRGLAYFIHQPAFVTNTPQTSPSFVLLLDDTVVTLGKKYNF